MNQVIYGKSSRSTSLDLHVLSIQLKQPKRFNLLALTRRISFYTQLKLESTPFWSEISVETVKIRCLFSCKFWMAQSICFGRRSFAAYLAKSWSRVDPLSLPIDWRSIPMIAHYPIPIKFFSPLLYCYWQCSFAVAGEEAFLSQEIVVLILISLVLLLINLKRFLLKKHQVPSFFRQLSHLFLRRILVIQD